MLPTDWSTDGQYIVYSQIGQTGYDLWVLALTPERKASPYLQGPFNEDHGRFSPDGHWVAYISDESGRYEVYIQPFPATGGKWQISRDGGAQPVWRRDGKELFYLASDSTLMAVPVTGGGAFEAGTPVPLFKTAISQPTGIRNQYAVSADGRRFLIITPTREMQSAPLTVVLNWTAGLKK